MIDTCEALGSMASTPPKDTLVRKKARGSDTDTKSQHWKSRQADRCEFKGSLGYMLSYRAS